MKKFIGVLDEVNLRDIKEKNYSLSPSMYRRVIIPAGGTKAINDLLNPDKPVSEKRFINSGNWCYSTSSVSVHSRIANCNF